MALLLGSGVHQCALTHRVAADVDRCVRVRCVIIASRSTRLNPWPLAAESMTANLPSRLVFLEWPWSGQSAEGLDRLRSIGEPFHTIRPDEDEASTVVLRAANASSTVVEQGGERIEVFGLPEGGARGYHSPDPGWRETPADEWGLDFVAARHGNVLVISTRNEVHYLHHRYALESLRIRVPAGVTVIRMARELTGKGDPDLSPPR